MMSLSSKITAAIMKIITYPYRKSHRSLSRSIKFKNKPYKPSKNYSYEVKNICGTNIEILSPANETNSRYAIVNFHGGGHTQGMNGMYRRVAERLSKISSSPILSIDYKEGDELIYPSVHDECFDAYVGLISTILKDKKIIVIGDSFGANLMLSTCLRLRSRSLPLPHAIISISGFIDLAATGDSYEKNCYKDPWYSLPKNQNFKENERAVRRITPYIGETSPFDPFLSPAYAEYDNFPDMLIQCGDVETSESDSDMLYERALKANVKATLTKYNGMWHDFQYITPFLKESRLAWKEIENFIKKVIDKDNIVLIEHKK